MVLIGAGKSRGVGPGVETGRPRHPPGDQRTEASIARWVSSSVVRGPPTLWTRQLPGRRASGGGGGDDGLIAEVAEGISGHGLSSCVMVHLSGATPLDALKGPRAVVWPIRSFNPKAGNVPLEGTPTVIEASDAASFHAAQTLAKPGRRRSLRLLVPTGRRAPRRGHGGQLRQPHAGGSPRGVGPATCQDPVAQLRAGVDPGRTQRRRQRATRLAKRGDDATLERHRALLPDDMRDVYNALAAHIAKRHTP